MPAEDVELDQSGTEDHDDTQKIHISRIPTSFTEESVQRILEEKLGKDTVKSVSLIYKRPEDEEGEDGDKKKGKNAQDGKNKGRKDNQANKKSDELDAPTTPTKEHRGFGFVVLTTQEAYQQAIDLESIRGGRKRSSSKKHTMYIRPYVAQNQEQEQDRQICYLWAKYRCPYGEDCKFIHQGDGGCVSSGAADKEQQKKRQKCFAFKKGKCKRGDDCPFSHDFVPSSKDVETDDVAAAKEKVNDKKKKTLDTKDRPNSEKDCINWKTKGKCRKGDKCPYKHDEALRKAALLKKKRRRGDDETNDDDTTAVDSKKSKRHNKQPLWVRVFGLNYETTQQDVRMFFESCGPIVEVEFPRFEDSGRSKGYCGVLFQSPKAVAKALELDGEELMGRWLGVQAGKMLLDQWEEREKEKQEQTKSEQDDE